MRETKCSNPVEQLKVSVYAWVGVQLLHLSPQTVVLGNEMTHYLKPQ